MTCSISGTWRTSLVLQLLKTLLFPAAVKRQVDILELKDLEKEYILSHSRLTLAQHHPPSAAIAGIPPPPSPTLNMFNTDTSSTFKHSTKTTSTICLRSDTLINEENNNNDKNINEHNNNIGELTL